MGLGSGLQSEDDVEESQHRGRHVAHNPKRRAGFIGELFHRSRSDVLDFLHVEPEVRGDVRTDGEGTSAEGENLYIRRVVGEAGC